MVNFCVSLRPSVPKPTCNSPTSLNSTFTHPFHCLHCSPTQPPTLIANTCKIYSKFLIQYISYSIPNTIIFPAKHRMATQVLQRTHLPSQNNAHNCLEFSVVLDFKQQTLCLFVAKSNCLQCIRGHAAVLHNTSWCTLFGIITVLHHLQFAVAAHILVA